MTTDFMAAGDEAGFFAGLSKWLTKLAGESELFDVRPARCGGRCNGAASGPNVAIIDLDTLAAPAECLAEVCGVLSAERFARRLAVRVAAHEVCHNIVARHLGTPADESPGETLGRLEQFAQGEPAEKTFPAAPGGHGAAFVRACINLEARLAAEGRSPTVPLFDPTAYGMSDISAYRLALGDEPARRIGEPIRAILASPAPEPFLQLWRADFQSWWDSSHPDESTPGPTQAAADVAIVRGVPSGTLHSE